MDAKLKIDFNEGNVQGSVARILVSEFDLVPNILKAQIEGDGSGIMIVSINAPEEVIQKCIDRLNSLGFIASKMDVHILHDDERCWSCGACTSVCPTKTIYLDKDTYEFRAHPDTCIACGSCLDACPVRALSLNQ